MSRETSFNIRSSDWNSDCSVLPLPASEMLLTGGGGQSGRSFTPDGNKNQIFREERKNLSMDPEHSGFFYVWMLNGPEFLCPFGPDFFS